MQRHDGRSWVRYPAPLDESLGWHGSLVQTSDGAVWANCEAEDRFYTIRYRPDRLAPETEITLHLEHVSQEGNTVVNWRAIDPWLDTFPKDLHYAWRLDGGAWSPFSPEREKVFFSLEPGPHVFEVKARDVDLNEDPTPAAARFDVAAPIWQQFWFIGLVASLAGLIALQTVRVLRRDTHLRTANEALRGHNEQLQQTREETEAARVDAEQANRAKSVFLANMSHELRTPLNAILGYTQLLSRDSGLSPTQMERLGTVSRSGEHLLDLINDVLTISKIEAGKPVLQLGPFDLHWQLQGLQDIFRIRTEDKGLALRLDVAANVPRYVHTDEGKLRQILMNLLSNAVKFTPTGGVALRVSGRRLEASAGEAQAPDAAAGILLHFEVEDTGVGIAPEEMDALFAPFVQTASGRGSHEGTGLGLPISRQSCELLGGEMRVESVVGQGSTFVVEIPVGLADEGDAAARHTQLGGRPIGIRAGQTTPDGGPFRLLVVEDNPANRALLIELLGPWGFELRHAVNGEEGVHAWEAWQPHLVWMDMRMPVLDGYEATRLIKARAKASGRPAVVVALTASAFEEDREAVLAAGCDDFVRKPFREEEIYEVLHRHLDLSLVYETATPSAETMRDHSPADLAALVSTLPATWAVELYQAVVSLDAGHMLELIEAARPQAPQLADTLAQWVQAFEYERVMDLVAPEEKL